MPTPVLQPSCVPWKNPFRIQEYHPGVLHPTELDVIMAILSKISKFTGYDQSKGSFGLYGQYFASPAQCILFLDFYQGARFYNCNSKLSKVKSSVQCVRDSVQRTLESTSFTVDYQTPSDFCTYHDKVALALNAMGGRFIMSTFFCKNADSNFPVHTAVLQAIATTLNLLRPGDNALQTWLDEISDLMAISKARYGPCAIEFVEQMFASPVHPALQNWLHAKSSGIIDSTRPFFG